MTVRQRDMLAGMAIASIVLLFLSLTTTFWQKVDNILTTYSRDLFSLIFFYPFFACVVHLFLNKRSPKSRQECCEIGFRDHFVVKIRLPSVVRLGLVVALSSFVTAYRFMVRPTPQGADTPQYLYVTNLLYHNLDIGIIIGEGRELTYLVFLAIRAVLENLFAQPFLISLMVFPIILTALYTVSVYRFVHTILNSTELALLASVFSGISIFTIRISYDLFAQQLALSLLLFTLTEYCDSVRSLRVSIPRLSLLTALLMLAHRFTWFFLLTILLIHMILTQVCGQSLPRKQVLLSVLLSVGIFILIEVIAASSKNMPTQWYERFATPTTYSEFLFPFEVGDAFPLMLPRNWNWIAEWESPFIIVLAAIGLVALQASSIDSNRLLIMSWLLTPGILLIATGYVQSYRLVILFPIGILSAYGVWVLIRGNIVKTNLYLGRILRAAFTIFMIILVLNSVLPRAYIANYVYYPGDAAINQLLSIRRTFGFSNSKVVVIVHPGTLESLNSFQYARAIVGSHVYVGELTDFLEGKPFVISNVRVQLSPDSLIVALIPTALYPLGRFEEILSDELSPGVRMIYLNPIELEKKVIESASFVDKDFTEGWYLLTNTMEHNFTSSRGSLTLAAEGHFPQDGWATYEKKMAGSITANKLVVSIRGNLKNLIGIVEVWYKDGTGQGLTLRNFVASSFSLHFATLDPTKPIDRIRVALYSDHETQSPTLEWLEIKFIALV